MDVLNKLTLLEKQYNVVNVFKYKHTTSWIEIKNYLYSKSLNGVVKSTASDIRVFLSLNGIKLLTISIKNYFKNIIFNRYCKNVYLGAGSGIFQYKNKIYDSYLPKDLMKERKIYMLSADFPDKLLKFKNYIIKNNIVIYSFLTAPIRIIMSKIISNFVKIKLDKNLITFLEKNFNITKNELIYIHSKFIVSYWVYKIFFYPFKISKAYIVSAYSNSAIIAVLKEKKVEVVELQHGIVGKIHRGYNYSVKSKLLPTPDKVFVYNDFWKQELLNSGYFSTEQIEVVGRLKYELIDKNIKPFNFEYIVFTGQGGFYNEIAAFINNSTKFLKENKYKFVYIPHPNENKSDLEFLKNKIKDLKLVVILNNNNKLYTTEQYIFSSIAHISVYSSCHFDAVHYKNRTYVYDIMSNNPIKYYIKKFPKQFIPIKFLDDLEKGEKIDKCN